jgi:CHRD domain
MARKILVALGTLLLAASCGDDDGGGETKFTVALTAADEVPVCGAAAASATGSAEVTVSSDNSTVTVNLTFSGLSGAATNAHVHYGAVGVMGGVIFPLGANPTSPINKTFTAADYPSAPPEGAPANFAGFVTDLKAGKAYVNVHTDACMPGEIRGQID